MYKKLVAVLAVLSILGLSVPVMAQTDQLDAELSKAIEKHFEKQGLSYNIINRILEIEKELPTEFVEAYHQLQHKLAAQSEYRPNDVVNAFVEFVPIYNRYYLQDREFISLLRFSLFDIPIRTGWEEMVSVEKLLLRLEVEYLGAGDALKYRSARDLQTSFGITDLKKAAIFADFATRVIQAQYATNPAPEELYDAYVVLEQDLLQAKDRYAVDVVKAFVKFAPAYLDFYAKHHDEAVALSDSFFQEKLVTGWASRYHPTTLRQVLADIEIEMLAGGDAYRYRNAEELVQIYKQEKHKKDRLTQEEAETFVNVSTRILKGKYFSEN